MLLISRITLVKNSKIAYIASRTCIVLSYDIQSFSLWLSLHQSNRLTYFSKEIKFFRRLLAIPSYIMSIKKPNKSHHMVNNLGIPFHSGLSFSFPSSLILFPQKFSFCLCFALGPSKLVCVMLLYGIWNMPLGYVHPFLMHVIYWINVK